MLSAQRGRGRYSTPQVPIVFDLGDYLGLSNAFLYLTFSHLGVELLVEKAPSPLLFTPISAFTRYTGIPLFLLLRST